MQGKSSALHSLSQVLKVWKAFHLFFIINVILIKMICVLTFLFYNVTSSLFFDYAYYFISVPVLLVNQRATNVYLGRSRHKSES